jgi:hypothetical protein
LRTNDTTPVAGVDARHQGPVRAVAIDRESAREPAEVQGAAHDEIDADHEVPGQLAPDPRGEVTA